MSYELGGNNYKGSNSTALGKNNEVHANHTKKLNWGLGVAVLGFGAKTGFDHLHEYMQSHQVIGIQDLVRPGEQLQNLMTDGDLPFRLYNFFMSHIPQAAATEFVDMLSKAGLGLGILAVATTGIYILHNKLSTKA